MTPEERLTRIENSIQALIETQARHEAGIRDLIVVSRTLVDSHKETTIHIQELRGTVQELRGTVQELRGTVQELTNAQRATDTKLNTLIETVDQLSRNVNTLVQSLRKPNGNQ